ncbi:serine/threonine-protein phosphatase [Streptomyces sp. NA04227]|uniref:ATP-binding SpoIIE family protein phosphatase n=1 Tax=Streptomyces sp. NA04227 TaxID=2742136 RepID=UPI001591B5DF|nr:ATP-binding SpoIIE family protein phosphatase [Streptomyces sp. NA04227]QKW09812.1 serine/threonine-protein phosphatase [Streptomyces sp. NA04227]
MSRSSAADAPGPPAPLNGAGAVLVDAWGCLRQWTASAAELLGYPDEELGGMPARRLLLPRPPGHQRPDGGPPGLRHLWLRHRTGAAVGIWALPIPLAGGAGTLVLGLTEEQTARWSDETATGRALLTQDSWQVAVHDLDLRIRQSSPQARRAGRTPTAETDPICEVGALEREGTVGDLLHGLVTSGEPVVDAGVLLANRPGEADRYFSLTAVRLDDHAGRATGVTTSLVDVTGRFRARRRLDHLHRAARGMGSSLDLDRTAQDLVDVLVPELADLASVEIVDAVARGAEPPARAIGTDIQVRRIAVAHAFGPWPTELLQPGERLPRLVSGPALREMEAGEALITRSRAEHVELLGGTAESAGMIPADMHTGMGAVLLARGRLLGYVQVQRTRTPLGFEEEDARLFLDIVARAALSMDTARRYTREHNLAVLLQQSLLPPVTSSTPAADTAGSYLPAAGTASVGGDWFDVLPLSSLRTAFVVGDVIGHGLAATATMARVRTAVQTLSDLDLHPDELLVRVDDLMARIAEEAEHSDTVGASCLYVVYDPATGRCRLASAGHPAPAAVAPDGTVRLLDVEPGPTLGVGGMPFEVTEAELAPGSVLMMYSDGFTDYLHGRPGPGGADLLSQLAAADGHERSLREIGDRLLAPVRAATRRQDDVTLLLARTRRIRQQDTAAWQFPPEPVAVAEAREAALGQLDVWGLNALAFSTELVVSELVTNVVRHAEGPVGLRLIRDQVLVCEVTDTSNSQPRLRQARSTDEGGRGLFLVAQLTHRWGSRYGDSGKTIWTEQSIPEDTSEDDPEGGAG